MHAQDVRVGHLDGVDLQVHVAGQQLVDHRLESVLKVLLADLVAKLQNFFTSSVTLRTNRLH